MNTHSHAFGLLTTQVFQANGLLIHWGDQFVADLGLTSARWQMLGALNLAKQPQTSPQIAERMGITRQGAQKQLNLLQESGLIEAHDNPAHKRSPLYSLTEQGKAVYAEVYARWEKTAEKWSADLSPAELAVAAKVLAHLVAQVKMEE
ncbi:MarR family winged helix-turn-helix transcriptional regulator [Neisseria iguanae]|uniref:MarR family transcriptional regulator n=1 Tax=Neisseria iguanae TaxID=90242 RepID=A0A2P7U3H7_9NEIS|nr:MarR family winged helix-turn-helix transcriptional regulator [Neisseria iguanae]PSJ81493.1 MarR family transcriptional regulator [Neisseria iguanae]